MSSKSPVVLIHGMWSTPVVLAEIRSAFEEEGYVVHTPCLPYHEARNQFTEEKKQQLATASIEQYVDAVLAYLADLGVPVILAGHSMGGLIAQLVAAKTACEKLILISSAAPAGINSLSWSALRTFGRNLFKFPIWKLTTNLLLKNIQYGIANTQSPAVQRDIIQKSTFESGRVSWQISMWFLYRKPPTKVAYDKVHCPVLVIGGTEDKITPGNIQRKIATKYPGRAQLILLPGVCHWTIGGSFFPLIKAKMFAWLQEQRTITTITAQGSSL